MADNNVGLAFGQWLSTEEGHEYFLDIDDGYVMAVYDNGDRQRLFVATNAHRAQAAGAQLQEVNDPSSDTSYDPRFAPAVAQDHTQLQQDAASPIFSSSNSYLYGPDAYKFPSQAELAHVSPYQRGTSPSEAFPVGSSNMSSGPSVTSELDSSFRVRGKPRDFFTVGKVRALDHYVRAHGISISDFLKVFQTPWTEPCGKSSMSNATEITRIPWGEVFTKLRRFVVVSEADQHCLAVPITTYGSQGVSKPGVKKSDHAIIYTGRNPPLPDDEELPRLGEMGMFPSPIRVDPSHAGEKLVRMSRINYRKIYTIEHFLKVRAFGVVLNREVFLDQFNTAFLNSRQV